MNEEMKEKKTLIQSFEGLKDPRNTSAIDHKLIDIIVIAILGTLCGANDFNGYEDFGVAKEKWLRSFLELPNGIPSHDTFNRVFSLLNPKEFHKCFQEWVLTLSEKISKEVISIDGKTARRTKCKSSNQKAIHVVSAWANKNKLVLGQLKVDDKSNEITAIPELLRLLDITGCIITIDAMGTQTAIADTIIDGGAEYVLALKENQPKLYNNVESHFNDEVLPKTKKELEKEEIYHKILEKDHGRIEKREYFMIKDVSWLEQANNWKNIQAVGMVRSERTIAEETTVFTRYYIMSDIKDVKEFSKAVRSHWGIENELHWCLDLGFREDESRARKDYSAENMNVVRHITLNMLKRETKCKQGISAKRLKCAWDNKYLEKVLLTSFEV